MFCKWCGNNLQLTDKKCPACGRETPPMSDCGGFYNLKHSNGGTTAPTTEKVIVKEVPHCAAVEKMEVKYTKERKAAKKHHAMTMLCFVVLLLAIVCTVILLVGLDGQLSEIKEQIENIQVDVNTPPMEDTTSELTEEQKTTDPVKPVPHSFVLDVTATVGESTAIGTSYNFGDYVKAVKVTTAVTESEKEQEIVVSFGMDDDAAINLDLVYLQEETEKLVIGVKCDSSLLLFENQEFTYEWQYQMEDGNWLIADEGLVDENNEYHSLCCDEKLWNIAGEPESPIELRCIITVEDEEENIMTITVDGFVFSQNISLS